MITRIYCLYLVGLEEAHVPKLCLFLS